MLELLVSANVLLVFAGSTYGDGSDLQCPNGFTLNSEKCYKYYNIELSVPDAQEFCEFVKSSLLAIDSIDEYHFIQHFLRPHQDTAKAGVILDGTDAHIEGEWVFFYKREPVTFLDWARGQPDNRLDGEECFELVPGHKMYDFDCDQKRTFVCEKQAAFEPEVIFG